MTEITCPYCGIRTANSDDHIFPRFLGGRSTIRACKHCNDVFGQKFESASFKHLKEWMFFLRRSGMRPPNPMVWKGVRLGVDGRGHDVDQDLRSATSDPDITRDAAGRITRVKWSGDRLPEVLKGLWEKGRTFRLAGGERVKIDIRQLNLRHPVDDDLKRMCIKASVACTQNLGVPNPLSSEVRRYLLGDYEEGRYSCPVQIAIEDSSDLECLRPPAGHLIYVHADPHSGRAWSIVQVFTALQFYCTLNRNWNGPEISVLGTLDPLSFKENFRPVTPISMPHPPIHVLPQTYQLRMQGRLERLRRELVSLYGDQAPINIAFNSRM